MYCRDSWESDEVPECLNKIYYIQEMARYITGSKYLGNWFKLEEKILYRDYTKKSEETGRHMFETCEDKKNNKNLEVVIKVA